MEAVLSSGKAGTPWTWPVVWEGVTQRGGRYLQEQLVLGDPLDGLD